MSGRFLAHENFPAVTVRWLRQRGDDVMHAAEAWPGASDETLLRVAREQDRIVLTFDRDFGDLVFHQRRSPARGIVLFRLHQQPPGIVLPFLESFFTEDPHLAGYFTVASPGQFRQAAMPR